MTKKNSDIEILVDALDFPNKGKGTYEGRRVTVKNTLPGQRVLARVSRKQEQRMEARLLEILEKAENEIPSPCGAFGECGGCAYQNITIHDENALKARQVAKLLENAGIKGYEFEGMLSSPVTEGYRNKCEFSFGDGEKDGPLELGMRKLGSMYEVSDLSECNIIDGDFRKITGAVLSYFRERGGRFLHKRTREGTLRHLVVRKGSHTGEILVNLITASGADMDGGFVGRLLSLELEGKICGILHTVNDGVADVVLCDSIQTLYGREYFTEELLGLRFKVTPFSFFQTNSRGAEVLYGIAREYAGDAGAKVIFDLYCGTGTIAQIMSASAEKVIGVEIDEEAAAAARENAEVNNITNCEFIAGDVAKAVESLDDSPDIIILDPPREGLHPKAAENIIKFGAPKIIYISCKPTSLARDLALFQDAGYRVERVRCVNQFPRTRHVETVALLSYKII